MNKIILIDMGSSTIKAYRLAGKTPKLFSSKSFHFKKNFNDKKNDLDEKDQGLLLGFIKIIRTDNSSAKIMAYATGVFRKINQISIKDLIKKLKDELNIELMILSHQEESDYLEKALIGRAEIDQKLMLLNIGGATTEIIVIEQNETIENHNIEIGVGTIISQYNSINEKINESYIKNIKEKISQQLPKLKGSIGLAFFSGGELTFMKRAGYVLSDNKIFTDPLHPSIISFKLFKEDNQKVFYNYSMPDMEKMYPENPTWVHGSRSCEVIAETIFEKYGIENVVPSDANLMDGIALEY